MGIFDWRNPNNRKAKKEVVTIECDQDFIIINNEAISFPTNYSILKSIIGEASRIEAVKQTNNKVYLWDELGVYCSTNSPEKMMMLLLVEDNRYGLGHKPKNNFNGNVLIDGLPLEEGINNVNEDRPYMIRAINKDNKRVAVALGWNPGR
ncbi:DUF7738 domain-containing protein [Winogradskyella jejuensis]|uniref:DUF7738 domain-containing protein n=1 Tax=Winogradskyella jejuensis TaxID=1089305 RepID=A0A1M5KTT8_9FLAO|nr:hypothetical protein [Winogradskyella jejuensis]SHG55563.1 hypothetical protein SAMN05444148_0417 [Winogradskyella jejuensis]